MKKKAYRLISLMVALTLALGGYYNALASDLPGARISGSQSGMLSSNVYYVSITGSDTNSGSATSPFKTFAKAVSALAAGDTLQVMAGIYGETLTLSTSGTATAPITVIGNGAILNMQGVKANGIVVSGSYINVSGFEAIGATDFGILVTGKYVIVENNLVHDNVTKNGVGTCGVSTSWGSALKVKVGGENTTIRNNTVYDNCGEGIAVTRGVVALIENNTVYDNFSVNIYVDNSPFVTVQNNLSYCTGTHLWNGNRATGIALGEETYTDWGAQLHDILISGNTISQCRTGIAAFISEASGTLTNVTITNNNVPSGQVRSISLQTATNQNVSVSYNTIFNTIYLYQPAGVTLVGNTISNVTPTSTNLLPSPTSTTLAPSLTPTLLPAATNTSTPMPTPILPTATKTATPIPVSPTFTATSIPSTPTIQVTSQASSGTIYDDRDSAFVYSYGWQNVADPQAYNGSYTVASFNKGGSSVSLSFTGQSFSVFYMSGPNYGDMNVYVDDILIGTINQKTSSTQYQQHWDSPSQLPFGTHTLKLVTKTRKNMSNSIDQVVVR